MVVIDIDDTLITDEKEITPGTKAALAAAVERGAIVTLATGRMYASARQIAGRLELNVPIITYQGSLVKNMLDGEVLYERALPADVSRFLLDYGREHGCHVQVYCDDTLYCEVDNERVRKYAAASNVPYTVVPDLHGLLDRPFTKVLIIDEPDVCDRLGAALKPLVGEQVHVTKSKPHYLEFVHREGTKGHAVRYLAGHFGIPLEAVIAIGDSWNDLDMIELAGLGVAMGNAVEPLKQAADYVTRTNNEEGVRHVVETFILQSA
jgi:hypothetical protein